MSGSGVTTGLEQTRIIISPPIIHVGQHATNITSSEAERHIVADGARVTFVLRLVFGTTLRAIHLDFV